MIKVYAAIVAAILLFAGVAGAQWWFNKQIDTAYKAGEQAGHDAEKTKWQTVLLDSQAKAEAEQQRLEKLIRQERKSWEDRLNALKSMDTDCMPPDVLRVLRDSGIYTGPIPCK